MTNKFAAGLAGALALAALGTGCWKDSTSDASQKAGPPAEPAVATAPAAAPAQPAAAPAQPAKTDPVPAADLKAGLVAMSARVLATVDGYQKVEPRQDDRYALHPDAGKNASIEFDVKGLQALTLSPYIADFSSVPDCEGNPQAGVVRMRWSLDGGAVNEVPVDRAYASTIDVQVGTASKLKVEVDEGNGVPWCDWFGVGIVNVK